MSLPLKAIMLGLCMQALWGGNAVSIKMALEAFPPLSQSFLRFLLGIACIAVWAMMTGHRLRPEPGEWRGLLSCALLFSTQIAFLTFGMDGTSGAMGTVLMATYPLWGGFFSPLLITGERYTVYRTVGMLVAFCGAAIVLLRGEGANTLSVAGIGNMIVLVSAMMLGFRLVWQARVMQGVDNVRLTVWNMILSLPVFLVGGLLFEEIKWEAVTWWPVSGLLYNGIVIAGLAFAVNNWMLKTYSPSAVVSLGFATPIFGVLAAWVLLGDPLTWSIAVGTAAVGAGLVLVTRRA